MRKVKKLIAPTVGLSVPPVAGKYVSTDVEAAPNGENMDGVLFATLLTQGDSGSGKVFFDVPADAAGLKLVFQPLTATEPIGSWS